MNPINEYLASTVGSLAKRENGQHVVRGDHLKEGTNMIVNDKNGFASYAIVFNPNKFYPGRAIELDGLDEEGAPMKGAFLITRVSLDRMKVVDSDGRQITLYFTSFVEELVGDEILPASIKIIFYGPDHSALNKREGNQ